MAIGSAFVACTSLQVVMIEIILVGIIVVMTMTTIMKIIKSNYSYDNHNGTTNNYRRQLLTCMLELDSKLHRVVSE